MSRPATPEQLREALAGSKFSVVTLPRRPHCPAELTEAIKTFDAGSVPAAVASARWLREEALDQYGSARTYVFVADGRVLGFFALSVALGTLEPDEAPELGVRDPAKIPAVLLAQAARRPDANLPPGVVFEYALAVTEDAQRRLGVAVLMLDAFDDDTDEMWKTRGLRPLRKPRPYGRPSLWIALGG